MSNTLKTWFNWASKREELYPNDVTFYAYEEAYDKALILLEGIDFWMTSKAYELLLFNVILHYVITNPYTYENVTNPLYAKYGISEKREGIVSSASDESSSASYHITQSIQNADFTTQDLMATPYGQYAYSVLEQLNIMPTLL